MCSKMHVRNEDGAVTEVLLLAESMQLEQQLLAVIGKLHGTYWPLLALVSTLLSQSPDNEKEMDPGSISLYKTEGKSKKNDFSVYTF